MSFVVVKIPTGGTINMSRRAADQLLRSIDQQLSALDEHARPSERTRLTDVRAALSTALALDKPSAAGVAGATSSRKEPDHV